MSDKKYIATYKDIKKYFRYFNKIIFYKFNLLNQILFYRFTLFTPKLLYKQKVGSIFIFYL